MVWHKRSIGGAPSGAASVRSAYEKSGFVPKSWRGWCSGGIGSSFSQFSVCFEVLEDLFDDPRIFDASDDLDGTAAMLTSIDVDVEHAFEALCPGHGGTSLCG